MKPQLTTTIRTLGALACLFAAGSAAASNYLNFTFADHTAFSNDSGQRLEAYVKEIDNTGWQKFAEFLGAGERWVWTQPGNEAVYIYNEDRKVAEKLVNFADPVGTSYSFSLGTCTRSGLLAEKGLTVNTAAGSFSDVVHMHFSGNCADSGLVDAWFAPKVGVIKWANQSLIGPVTFSLTDGNVGGVGLGADALQTALKVSAHMPGQYIVVRDAQTVVGASLEVTNSSNQNLVLHFNSGQEFEISLLNSSGQVVNYWSANVRFIQGTHDVTIGAGKSRTLGGVLALRNLNGQALATGQYSLRIEIKDAQAMFGSVSVPTTIRTESPLYIQRSM